MDPSKFAFSTNSIRRTYERSDGLTDRQTLFKRWPKNGPRDNLIAKKAMTMATLTTTMTTTMTTTTTLTTTMITTFLKRKEEAFIDDDCNDDDDDDRLFKVKVTFLI